MMKRAARNRTDTFLQQNHYEKAKLFSNALIGHRSEKGTLAFSTRVIFKMYVGS
jgi:hypothetical protein